MLYAIVHAMLHLSLTVLMILCKLIVMQLWLHLIVTLYLSLEGRLSVHLLMMEVLSTQIHIGITLYLCHDCSKLILK